jgi:DNA-binding protein
MQEQKQAENAINGELRVTTRTPLRRYVPYCWNYFQKNDQQEISISAAGAAISKAVQLAEIVKRRIGGLYQVNKLFSQEMASKPRKDEGAQQIEGEENKDSKDSAEVLEVLRHVSVIEIKLSKVELDKTAFGYQKPIPREAPGKVY